LPTGVLLSGGLDSRVLLALLSEVVKDKLYSFTWGVPGCDDARFAREVSTIAGAENHFFELKPDYLLALADKSVRLTDGMGSVVNLHALATLDAQTRYAKAIYKGFMGDAMMGYGLTRHHWANCAREQLAEAHYAAHDERNLLAFKLDEHDDLFAPDFRRQIGSAVWESYRAALQECPAPLLAQQRLYFDLRQRVPRMTINGVEVVRSLAVARLPFCDNDLVDWTLRVPPGLLYDRYLIKKAFVEAFPRLARVPYTDTGLPMAPCARDVLIRLDQQIRWRLRGAGLTWVQEPKRRPYANYNHWLRTTLRPWVEELMLSERAAQRGIFKPAAVRRLVDEQMAGAKHAVKLGALLTIELWHRLFVD
jgi:asparagine synthase (glutamine-hydrolysing)